MRKSSGGGWVRKWTKAQGSTRWRCTSSPACAVVSQRAPRTATAHLRGPARRDRRQARASAQRSSFVQDRVKRSRSLRRLIYVSIDLLQKQPRSPLQWMDSAVLCDDCHDGRARSNHEAHQSVRNTWQHLATLSNTSDLF